MKKFFIALEEQNEEVAVLDEELAPELLTEENPDDITDVESDVEEIITDVEEDITDSNRANELSESLESLCEIIRHIDSPTPVNVALIKVAANMAVAGTDVPATSLFSANEDFTDLNVTVEGIQDKIVQISKAVFNSVKTVSLKLVQFFKSVFSAYSRYTARISELKKKLTELKKIATAKTVSVEVTGGRFFRHDGNKEIQSAAEFLTVYKESVKNINSFAAVFAPEAVKYYRLMMELNQNIVTFGEKAENKFIDIYTGFDNFFNNLKKLPGVSPEQSTKNSGRNVEVYSTKAGLGGVKLIIEMPKENTFDKTSVKSIKNVVGDYKLSSKSDDNSFVSEKITFDNVNIGYVETLLTQCEENLKAVKAYSSVLFKYNTWISTYQYPSLKTSSGNDNIVAVVYSAMSANFKLMNSINSSLAFMGKASWRNANGTISTAIKVADKILSSKEWIAS